MPARQPSASGQKWSSPRRVHTPERCREHGRRSGREERARRRHAAAGKAAALAPRLQRGEPGLPAAPLPERRVARVDVLVAADPCPISGHVAARVLQRLSHQRLLRAADRPAVGVVLAASLDALGALEQVVAVHVAHGRGVHGEHAGHLTLRLAEEGDGIPEIVDVPVVEAVVAHVPLVDGRPDLRRDDGRLHLAARGLEGHHEGALPGHGHAQPGDARGSLVRRLGDDHRLGHHRVQRREDRPVEVPIQEIDADILVEQPEVVVLGGDLRSDERPELGLAPSAMVLQHHRSGLVPVPLVLAPLLGRAINVEERKLEHVSSLVAHQPLHVGMEYLDHPLFVMDSGDHQCPEWAAPLALRMILSQLSCQLVLVGSPGLSGIQGVVAHPYRLDQVGHDQVIRANLGSAGRHVNAHLPQGLGGEVAAGVGIGPEVQARRRADARHRHEGTPRQCSHRRWRRG
mmetsp:Transcript_51802/g.134849  ORF Transcript_51802/g.134849 Transcript_51802/m.134849 type:complete len:459 (-) Transcript_51802:38-1414(-)